MKLKPLTVAVVTFCVLVLSICLSGVTSLPTEAASANKTTQAVVTTTTKSKKQTNKQTSKETTTTTKASTTKNKKKKAKKATAETTTTTKAPTKIFPDSDLEMMAIVIYREAGGDAYSNKTRIMVGNVVMNRVRSSQFPNTIRGVLTQRGQYAGMSRGVTWPSMASNRWEKEAVRRAWACARRVQAGENYLPANVVYQSDYRNLGHGTYCISGGMYFNYA